MATYPHDGTIINSDTSDSFMVLSGYGHTINFIVGRGRRTIKYEKTLNSPVFMTTADGIYFSQDRVLLNAFGLNGQGTTAVFDLNMDLVTSRESFTNIHRFHSIPNGFVGVAFYMRKPKDASGVSPYLVPKDRKGNSDVLMTFFDSAGKPKFTTSYGGDSDEILEDSGIMRDGKLVLKIRSYSFQRPEQTDFLNDWFLIINPATGGLEHEYLAPYTQGTMTFSEEEPSHILITPPGSPNRKNVVQKTHIRQSILKIKVLPSRNRPITVSPGINLVEWGSPVINKAENPEEWTIPIDKPYQFFKITE